MQKKSFLKKRKSHHRTFSALQYKNRVEKNCISFLFHIKSFREPHFLVEVTLHFRRLHGKNNRKISHCDSQSGTLPWLKKIRHIFLDFTKRFSIWKGVLLVFFKNLISHYRKLFGVFPKQKWCCKNSVSITSKSNLGRMRYDFCRHQKVLPMSFLALWDKKLPDKKNLIPPCFTKNNGERKFLKHKRVHFTIVLVVRQCFMTKKW